MKPLLASKKLWTLMLKHTVPRGLYGFGYAENCDVYTSIAEYIKQGRPDFASAMFNVIYVLELVEQSGLSAPGAQKAIAAYIQKYPDHYTTLKLHYLLFKTYEQQGQLSLANSQQKEMEAIAQKRGIKLLTSPDPRFSSPEKTWALRQKATRQGNIDLLLECYAMDRVHLQSKIFKALDKYGIKSMQKEIAGFAKVSSDANNAVYEIVSLQSGKHYAYQITFMNEDGEWKIAQD